MRKGDIYEAVVTNYDFPNKGSLILDNRKVTIKGALVGQRVRFMITKRKSGMAEARLLEVLERAPIEDAEPSCPYFGMCGGCAYQTMSYDNQLKLKERMVRKLLDKVLKHAGSGSEDYVWEGILASPVTEAYRNKMEFTFGDEYKDGPLALGLHKKGSFHDILHVKGCRIIGEDWNRILEYTQTFFREKKVPFYHRLRHEGILRNLVVRQSKATGGFLINLVTSTQWAAYGFVKCETGCNEGVTGGQETERQVAGHDGADGIAVNIPVLCEYVKGLLALEKDEGFAGHIAGILYTENDSLGDVVQCDRMVCLYGRDYIMEEVIGLRFKISPFSFFQTNTRGCEVLYEKAREYIMDGSVLGGEGAGVAEYNGAGGKIVFDLYSGTGTIAQMMSAAAGKVLGIEIVEEAVEAAKENAQLNGLTNCEFIAGDVLKAIDLVQEKPDVIILDPPRDGIHPKALEKIAAQLRAPRMIYISCKPTSLARDLEKLQEYGYVVERVCCVDMFPGTYHVETVCSLRLAK